MFPLTGCKDGRHVSSSKVEPKRLRSTLVAGWRIAPHLLHVSRWDQTNTLSTTGEVRAGKKDGSARIRHVLALWLNSGRKWRHVLHLYLQSPVWTRWPRMESKSTHTCVALKTLCCRDIFRCVCAISEIRCLFTALWLKLASEIRPTLETRSSLKIPLN